MIKKIVVPVIFCCLVGCNIGISQTTPYKVTFSQSAPEASLFFINPSYVSPAQAYGVTGVFSNPAALGFSSDYGLAFAFGLSQKPTIECNAKIMDSTDAHGELKVPLELTFKEQGGLNFIGFSKKLGPAGIGIGYMQKAQTGFCLEFEQADSINLNYEIEQDIKAFYSGRDTMIPVKWTISTPLYLKAKGTGDINFGKTPLFLGSGIAFGPAGIGAGFKLSHYSGKLGADAYFVGSGEDSAIGRAVSPFKGQIKGVAKILDTLMSIKGTGDLSANRLSLVLGGLLRLGFFKMGLSFEQGFKTTLSGDYSLTTVQFSDAPDSIKMDSNFVYFVFPDSIYGRVRYTVGKSKKSSDTLGGAQVITLPGYTELNLGISLSIFDLYAGLTIPKKEEINNLKLGLLFSIPLQVVTVRTGFLATPDYVITTDNKIVLLRIPVYFGLGGSVKTQFGFIPMVPDAQIDFGVKSNALPWFSKLIPSAFEDVSDIKPPSTFSLFSFNLGIGLGI